jgi:hypothetical protein
VSWRFEELRGAATQAPTEGSPAGIEQAAGLLAEALALWRGPALDGIDLDGCRAEVAQLEERRLAVLEERIDLDLWLSRQAALVGELQALAPTYPLRERLWAQLMLALHRADRQADALATYRQLRQVLVDQLGVEPGATVQQVHRAVLAGGDALADYLRARGLPAAPRPEPTSAALPAETGPAAAPGGFTGRTPHLKRLDDLLSGDTAGLRVAVISGMAGSGRRRWRCTGHTGYGTGSPTVSCT